MQTAIPELRNVFQAAAVVQHNPREIRAAASALGIQPAARHNGLALYSPKDLDAIAAHLAHKAKKDQ